MTGVSISGDRLFSGGTWTGAASPCYPVSLVPVGPVTGAGVLYHA